MIEDNYDLDYFIIIGCNFYRTNIDSCKNGYSTYQFKFCNMLSNRNCAFIFATSLHDKWKHRELAYIEYEKLGFFNTIWNCNRMLMALLL